MVTKRTTIACVVNRTDTPIFNVTLIHKYSSLYKDFGSWPEIAPNARSGFIPIQFHTGLLHTGTDWWVVLWRDSQGRLCKTNPNNLRWLLDSVTKEAPTLLSGAHRGNKAMNDTVGYFKRTESTDGFKKYLLTDLDVTEPVFIILREGGKVTFESAAGSAETLWEST
eukprot:Blabericola_migrator_1__1159@NODE_129_length_13297_cov_112_007559_g114_i0_p8_GENE_NODE_129_length_13297_cov_112_007559_g114_i0NODE_129_length_13297_cov_112_007559_g114_i0_p8_ORF_typecomplete_len167_score22_42PUD1_2/PF18457_1/1_7e31_NODE_129_length_13297_cov_112_007559_g114_i0999510495